jgi:hypothetical protein
MVRGRAAVALEVLVVWAFVYLALRRLPELLVLCWRSADANEVEILVLRHQLADLRRSTSIPTAFPAPPMAYPPIPRGRIRAGHAP